MRLKHLTLHGFKTFAAKTEFSFDGDITAIIGPNGSGKSNVADALRWVLGEQSHSQLRARRSEDLIFLGSPGRTQLGMAEVTLVLDNTDRTLPIAYDEVSITRRAFRSGENEYYINRSRVRLRDVLDLLAPIGQSFTAVGQGLADELLSLRPEERRALFEEAAGIRPFFAQRDDALRRLARTEDNMLRVNDLVAEIEPQLKHLERQARHAQEHDAVVGELRGLLDGWYGAQWRQAQAACETARAAEAAAADALARARAAAASAERRLQETRAVVAQHQAEVERRVAEQQGVLQQGDYAARAAAVQTERLAALEQQQQATLQEHESGREALAQAQAELAGLLAVEDGTVAAERALRADVGTAESAQHRAVEARRAADRALAAAQERAAAGSAQAAGLRQRLAGSQDHRAELERQLADQQAAADRLAARQEAEEAESAAAAEALRAAEAAQATAVAALAAAEQALHAAQQAREHAEKERRAAAAEVDSLATRLDLARRVSEGGHGLPHPVRAVLQAPGLTGRHGVVALLIQVPAALETAIEVALGGRIHDVVVSTWGDAEAAVAWLRENRAGRATFLPLDSLRVAETHGDPVRGLTGRAGVEGVAARLVSAAPEYAVVVDYLLGRTLVVADLPVARQVLPRVPGGWNIVTLGGDIVRAGGAVTGGSAAREHGVLAREREQRELAAALEQAQALVAARTRTAGQTADGVARAEAGRQAAAEAARAAARHAAERREAAGHLAQRRAQSAQEATWRAGLVRQAQEALDDWGCRLAGFAAELETLESQSSGLVAAIATLQQAALEARGAEARARDEVTALRTRLAVAEEGARHRRAAVQAAQTQQARLADQQRARALRLESLEADLAQAAAALDAARAGAARWDAAAADLRGRVAAAQQALAAAREQQAALDEAQRAAQGSVLAAESAYGHRAIDRERQKAGADQLRVRIVEDLELGAGAAEPDPDAWPAWAARWAAAAAAPDAAAAADVESRIGLLRGRLRRMGPINPLAVEEFATAQARHGFLTGQLRDLETAAASLRQVAADLDRLMRERLSETFAAVAAAFRETFPRLFGGGSARLELTDPADVTATGIEIIAQTPGKRAQPLSALSGGERALTSVALLFAILRVRPTPFCIMDEVDAALDEANIGRFRNELRELSARSQFILITHNRATIEVAAAIYGISLAPDSASRVLSLRLEEVPLAA